MKIDYWYNTGRSAAYADCYFYPDESVYRGNIYDANGKIIGDYTASNSLEVEKRFQGIFGE